MPEVQLLIPSASKFVDLYENESISQTWRFTDVSDFGTRGSFSRQFRVPANKNNTDIFGPLYEANYVPATNYFTKKLSAVLTVDTLPIAVGHIRLNKVYKQQGILSDFELTFFAETPDLIRSLGEKKLKDIAGLNDLAHTIGYDAVTNTTENYRYALVDRGFKFSNLGEAGTRRIDDLNLPVWPAEMTPLVRWSFLFDKIMTEAGFSYDAADLITALEGYWMPFINDKFLKVENPPQQYYFSVYRSTDLTSFTGGEITGLTEDFDNNGDFATNTYVAPVSGYYRFKSWMTIDPTNSSSGVVAQMSIRQSPYALSNSVVVAPPFTISTGMASGTQTYTQQHTYSDVFLEAGTSVKFYISNAIGTIKGSATNDPNTGTGWGLVQISGSLAGEEIDLAANAPDMLQVDFIKDIQKMHNLAIIPDPNIPNKLKFESLATYIGSGDTYDWTGKLDISQDISLSTTVDLQKKKLSWSYKAGSDVASKLYQNLNRIYGDYVVDGYTVNENTEASDFLTGETAVQLVTLSTPCSYVRGTSIIIPKFYNENGEFVIPGPRCLFISGTASVALYNDNDLEGQITAVNLVNHYSTSIPDIDDFDLNFAPEIPLHDINSNPYNNLFNLYWRDYLNEIYSPEARVMEASFALTLTDILNFQFSNKYWIKDAWWRVLEISDYKVGLNESTRVTLMKIINVERDCQLTPVEPSRYVVQFVDENGDPAASNQLCCERYGYTWTGSMCVNSQTGGGGYPVGGLQGTRGIGYSVDETQRADFIVSLASKLNTHPTNVYSYIAGSFVTIEAGNPYSIIAGETIKIEGEQRGGMIVAGKNTYTNTPGIHLGGGWQSDLRSDIEGEVQFGSIPMSVKGGLADNSATLELLIEGISGKRISVPDKTAWSCILTISMNKITAGVVSDQAIAQFAFNLTKETTAAAGTVHDVFKQTTFVSPTLTIDTATDTSQHRLKIGSSGSGHPHNDLRISAKLDYVQVRHE